MNILHVWDQAGVSCVLAKFQRLRGNNVTLLKKQGFDRFGILKFYNEPEIKFGKSKFGSWQFYKKVLKQAKDYDVIHVHDLYKIIPPLRKKYPKKVVILHYHGATLRNTPAEKRKESEMLSDQVIVVHSYLKNYVNAIHIPNIVDTFHFFNRKVEQNNRALMQVKYPKTREKISKMIKESGLGVNFELLDRENKSKFIDFKDLPDHLASYEYYIDINFINDEPERTLSLTALQALSVGCKVIRYDLTVVEKLLEDHLPDNALNNIEKIYFKNLEKYKLN